MPAASTATAEPTRHRVLILGAGMSGLCMAAELLRTGQHDFVILEQSAGLGGTWWDNRYPGAQVDVPAPLYSLSFAPNPRWKRRFAAASEIQAYMQHVAERFGVVPHIRFGQTVTGARFDEATGLWRIETAGGEAHEARFFVCSTGPLSRPRWPAIEGLETFAGARVHSARWDATLPLADRRVGVIGTGSTAAQLVPELARAVGGSGRLVVFQRTANWVLPRLDRRYTALDRAFNRIPGWHRLVRAGWHAVLEWGRRGFDEGTAARAQMTRMAERLLQRQVPDAALRERLRAPYPLGCKRIIYSNDYLRTFTQATVSLQTNAILRATPAGLITADGTEHTLDVLVCATGFDVQDSLAGLPVVGRGGRTLAEAWRDGPQAHLGLTVAGFPNLFLMLGPNTATGHTSTLLFIEPGVRWAVRAMQAVQQRGARWLDVKADVQARFNDRLQQRLAGAVWSRCRSWYRADSGRNIAIWPGFTREYVRAVAAQDLQRDFDWD